MCQLLMILYDYKWMPLIPEIEHQEPSSSISLTPTLKRKKTLNMYIKQEKNDNREGQDILEDDIMVMVETNINTLLE